MGIGGNMTKGCRAGGNSEKIKVAAARNMAVILMKRPLGWHTWQFDKTMIRFVIELLEY